MVLKTALRSTFDDTFSDCSELLEKANMCSVELGRLEYMATEIFKKHLDLNPLYLSDLISKRNCR